MRSSIDPRRHVALLATPLLVAAGVLLIDLVAGRELQAAAAVALVLASAGLVFLVGLIRERAEARSVDERVRALAAITSETSAFDVVAERIYELSAPALGATGWTLWALDGDGLRARCRAGEADHGEVIETADEHPVARALTARGAAVVSDYGVLAPLRAGGEPVGVVQFHVPAARAAAARRRVARLAELLAPAVAAERLRAALEEREHERGELFDYMVEMRDKERQSLAHRLHDGPQQTMTALRLMSDVVRQAIRDGDTARAEEVLARLEGFAVDVAAELRRMSASLHPVVMEQQGLHQALGSLAESLQEEHGVSVRYDGTSPGAVDDPARDGEIFQIAREAAVNAVRYGREPVVIRLGEHDGALRLSVEDSGGGLDAEAVRSGIGMRMMRERAARIGARIDFDVEPGMRTEIRLDVPAPVTSRG